MTLCALCKSIPIADIPSPGSRNIVDFGKTASQPPLNFWQCSPDWQVKVPLADGTYYPFHQTIGSLQMSARSCALCHVIWDEVDTNIQTFNQSLVNGRERFALRTRTSPVTKLQGPLKITARLDEGSGFAVVLDDEHCPMYLVLANCATTVPYDCPYADQILARPIGRRTVCEESLAWLHVLLDDCGAHHSTCNHHSDSMPKRILSLENVREHGKLKLIRGGPTWERYATLSYCWGTSGRFFTMTSKNIEQFMAEGIDVAVLPATLKDAVEVALGFGLRYLWVDALCIKQDDREDWALHAAEMAPVYGNAWITIAAQEASHADEGCIYDLPPKFSEQVTVPLPNQVDSATVFAIDAVDFRPRNLSNTPLISRGWAFQERALASRIVYLCRNELKFECRELFVTQFGHQDVSSLQQAASFALISSAHDSEHARKEQRKLVWEDIVHDYNGRALTHQNDKLPALSGIAKEFQKYTQAVYVAGLWSDSILESLLFEWCGGQNWGSVEKFYEVPTVPSWSWAAYYGSYSFLYNDVGELIAQLKEWNVKLESKLNPYGEVSSGYLIIQAPLLPLKQRLDPDKTRTASAVTGVPMEFRLAEEVHSVQLTRSRVLMNVHRRTNPNADVERLELYLLVICWCRHGYPASNPDKPPDGHDVAGGIIVSPAGPGLAEMRRLGVLRVHGKELRRWSRLLDQDSFPTVTLV